MCSSCSALFAVKKAIVAARKEIDNKDFFSLGMYNLPLNIFHVSHWYNYYWCTQIRTTNFSVIMKYLTVQISS